MKRGKILIYIALFFLAMPLGLLGLTVRADEVPTETTLVIHKRVFIDANAEPEIRVNNGAELDQSNDLANPQKTFGLNGAIFEVYDATEYITRLQADYSNEEIEQAVLDADLDDLRKELTEENKLGEVTTGTLDGEVGIATISIENLTSDPTMFIILEKASLPANTTIRSITVPMLISLPVTNPDPTSEEAFLSTVHLYPKSTIRGRLPQTGGETPTPTPTPTPTVTPKPTGRLPQTGEAKTMMGLFGLAIVGTVSIVWFKRNSNKKMN